MSFMGMFPNRRERRLARDEAWHAVQEHGAKAESFLLMKAQKTESAERRVIYKLACKILSGGGGVAKPAG